MSAEAESTTAKVPQVSTQVLTVEQFRQALPDKVKKSVSQELIDQINLTLSDPDMYEQYRDNLLSYTKVMVDGRFKVDQYLSAVKYVSHKLLGCSNLEAYSKTFPEKITRFQSQGVSNKDISAYVSAYNKSKLVNLIFEQTLVPSWVLNQDIYQQAINTQAELMLTANSEKVRSDAANSLLTHLKPPETQKVELEIGVKQDSAIGALRDSVAQYVAQQKTLLQAGALTAQEAAKSTLVFEGEVVDE